MLAIQLVTRANMRIHGEKDHSLRTCDAYVLRESCGEREACISNVCRQLPPLEVCDEGPATANCSCALGLEKHLGQCVHPERLSVATGRCSPQDLELPLQLRNECLRKRGLESGSLLKCGADIWRSISPTKQMFHLGLLEQTESFLVHFDPEASEHSFDSGDRIAYGNSLKPHLDSLRGAKAILIIGHPARQDDAANLRSEQRAAFVADRIRDALEGESPNLWHWTLHGQLTINTSWITKILKQRGRKHLHDFPPVTWRRDITEHLLVLLNPGQIDPVHQDQSDWLSKMFRHSVLVVPLYCDGTEFDPTHWSKQHDRTNL